MNATKWILLVVLAILVAGVGAAIHYPLSTVRNASEMTADSKQASAESGPPLAVSAVCTGYVDLEHGLRSLAPLRPGRVAEVLVQEGQHVQAGAPILRLEDQDAQLQRKAAELAVETAEVQLAETLKIEEQQRARLAQQQAALLAAGSRLDAARQLLQRKEEQLKKGLVSTEEVIIARAEVKALEQAEQAERAKLAELKTVDPSLMIRKAKTQLKQAQIQREQAQYLLDECILRAPTAGTVQRISVGVGDIVTGNATQPVAGAGIAAVVRFAPDEPLLVRAEVDQEFVDRIQIGQTALIRDDTHAGTFWHGKVQRIASWFEQRRPTTLDPSAFTDVRTVECLISIDPGQPPLRLGQRMRVMIGRPLAQE